MAGSGEVFRADTNDLKGLFAAIKEVEPKLATQLRRELRQSGDVITREQKRELGSGDLRDRIAAGLRTRVQTGARQGIQVKSTGPRINGYNLARVMNKPTIRHPVFGTDTWVEQPGHPYFFKPATPELQDLMRNRITAAIEQAIADAHR